MSRHRIKYRRFRVGYTVIYCPTFCKYAHNLRYPACYASFPPLLALGILINTSQRHRLESFGLVCVLYVRGSAKRLGEIVKRKQICKHIKFCVGTGERTKIIHSTVLPRVIVVILLVIEAFPASLLPSPHKTIYEKGKIPKGIPEFAPKRFLNVADRNFNVSRVRKQCQRILLEIRFLYIYRLYIRQFIENFVRIVDKTLHTLVIYSLFSRILYN